MRKIVICFLISILSLATYSVEAKNRKAHVHGVASLTFAIEDKRVEIEFETPADSLFGFEHKAKETEERKVVIAAEGILKSPQALFSFSGAKCKVENTSVDLSEFITDEHHHDNHSHDEKKHDDHHDHDSDNHDSHDHDEKHSEVHVGYSFNCDNAQKITSISTEILTQFPRVEKVKVMWITESGQGSENLDKSKKTISLK